MYRLWREKTYHPEGIAIAGVRVVVLGVMGSLWKWISTTRGGIQLVIRTFDGVVNLDLPRYP